MAYKAPTKKDRLKKLKYKGVTYDELINIYGIDEESIGGKSFTLSLSSEAKKKFEEAQIFLAGNPNKTIKDYRAEQATAFKEKTGFDSPFDLAKSFSEGFVNTRDGLVGIVGGLQAVSQKKKNMDEAATADRNQSQIDAAKARADVERIRRDRGNLRRTVATSGKGVTVDTGAQPGTPGQIQNAPFNLAKRIEDRKKRFTNPGQANIGILNVNTGSGGAKKIV